MSGRVECIRRRFENAEKPSSTANRIPPSVLGNATSTSNSSSAGVRRSPAFRGGVDAKKEAARSLLAQRLAKHVNAVNSTTNSSPPTETSNHQRTKNTLSTYHHQPINKTLSQPINKTSGTPSSHVTPSNKSPIKKNVLEKSVSNKVNMLESNISKKVNENTSSKIVTSSEIKMLSKELIYKFEKKDANESKTLSQNGKETNVSKKSLLKERSESESRDELDSVGNIYPHKDEESNNQEYKSKQPLNKSNTDSNESLTESVRLLLKTPLPSGPPPRKPPRTFAHSTTVNDTKQKLAKLEVALKNRGKGRIILPRIEQQLNGSQLNQTLECSSYKEIVNELEESVASDKTKNSCLGCLGGSNNCEVHVYDGTPLEQSEFFVPTERRSEHIYAEPFKNLSSSSTEPAHLHYMSTPIDQVKRADTDLASSTPDVSTPPINSLNEHLSPRASRIQRQPQSPTSFEESSLDRTKIQLLMNQAFGAPLHEPQFNAAVLDDEFEDNDPPSSSNGHSVDSSSEEAVICQLTLQRKMYVRHMSSQCQVAAAASASGTPSETLLRRASTSPSRIHKKSLYEVILLVGLNLEQDQAKTKTPYVKLKFPSHAQVPYFIEHLVFPEASQWPLVTDGHLDQCYTLVITDESGTRKYGYCRRVLPEKGTTCLPLAYCLITPHKANGFYHKVLAELEFRHGQPEQMREHFMSQLYKSEFPTPGHCLSVIVCSSPTDNTMTNPFGMAIRRPIDSRMEDRDLSDLFNTLPVPVILQLFSSLLLERKLVLLSYSISLLSSCIEGLQTLLYPFIWVHTVVPVVPEAMVELVNAPTPFLIGVLKHLNPPQFNIDQGVIVDLDTGQILSSVGDESSILPARIRRCLKSALQLVDAASLMEPGAHHVLISEAFIRSWVELCGHFETHIVTQQDSRRVFERESFIKAAQTRSVQCFLEWFSETAMYSNFITSKLEQTESRGLFEQRILEHSEEMEKNTALFMKNYRVLNKKVKTLSDRLKDWTSFS